MKSTAVTFQPQARYKSDAMDDKPPATLAPLFLPRCKGKGARTRERSDGLGLFARASQSDRLILLKEALRINASRPRSFNAEVFGAFLRAGFDMEPYLNGKRIGNYLTALTYEPDSAVDLDYIVHLAWQWGPFLMDPVERRALKALRFPMTVYRGGVGPVERLASGMSWTSNEAQARWFADEWPRRWGIVGDCVVVSRQIEFDDVAAYFIDRLESEFLLPPY